MSIPNPCPEPSRRRCASVIAALATPCTGPGEADAQAAGRWASQLTRRGCDGIFALSSTGEMVLIDEPARRRLTASVREALPADVELLVGVGGSGSSQVIRYARFAADDGADVAVVMAPFFQRLSQSQLVAYVESIADQSPIPVGIYHHLRMPTSFDVESLARLAEHPNVTLCKDTSTDVERMARICAATRGSGLRLLQGSERWILPSLRIGADGCVSALAGIAPEWHRELVDAFRGDRSDVAEERQQRLLGLAELFQVAEVGESLTHFVHTLKYAAVRRGWLTNAASLLPGFEPSAGFERAIEEKLQRSGLLNGQVVPHADESHEFQDTPR